uniref:Uncharacterized protein n=1 Tax=Ciona intestinalis TaxID=7719 RepID=F6QCD1_CIOIN
MTEYAIVVTEVMNGNIQIFVKTIVLSFGNWRKLDWPKKKIKQIEGSFLDKSFQKLVFLKKLKD